MNLGDGYVGACLLSFPFFFTLEIFLSQKCGKNKIIMNVFFRYSVLYNDPVKKKTQVIICLYSVFLDVIQQKNSEILWNT